MANKIAVNYNTASFLMSSMKLGIPNAGTHSLSRKTIPALIWPVKETVEGVPIIGNVVFQNIGRDHTICVSFTKIGEPPTIIGNVVFVGIKKNHTIHVTFTHVIELPEPISNHTKLLLLFNDNHTALRPEFYMEGLSEYEFDLMDVDTSLTPWFTSYLAPMADTYSTLVDFIKDNSVYNHTMCQIVNHRSAERSLGCDFEQWCLGYISSLERIEGRSGFIDNLNYAFDPSFNYLKNQYLPGCKLGADDFTIDFWWKESLINRCGMLPFWEGMDDYHRDVFGKCFFRLRESNKYNYDGSYNNELIHSPFDSLGIVTYDPINDAVNSHARMEYQFGAFLQVKENSVNVIYSGVASDDDGNTTTSLVDLTKSWGINELAGKTITIVSGTGSVVRDSFEQYIDGGKIYIYPGPKLILSNTETKLTLVMCTRTYKISPTRIKDDISYTFPATPDETSHYEIMDNIPQYRLVLQYQGDVFDPITHTGVVFSGGNSPDLTSNVIDVYSGILPYNTILDKAGLWNHIAFVRFRDNIKCYFNGVALEEEFNIPFKFIENKSENYMMQVSVLSYYEAMDVFRINDIALWTKNFDPFDPIMLPNIYFDMELSLDSRLVGDDILLLLHMNGEDESTYFYDSSKYRHPVYNNSDYSKIINNVGVISPYSPLIIDYFDINIDQTREFTIDFWIKFISNPDGKIVAQKQNFMNFYIQSSPMTGSALGLSYFDFGFCVNNGVPSICITYPKKISDGAYFYMSNIIAYIDISGVFCTANMVNVNKWVHFALVWHGLELKLYINGYHMGDTIQEPYLYNIRKALTIGAGVWGYEMDEIRISSRAEWTENFIPPTAPYVDPTLPSYNEVNPVFDLTSDMEIIARFPGEYDIEHNMIMNLVMQMDDIRMPPIEFNTNTSLNVYMNVVEKQYDFVFSNRWLKELLSTYPDVPGFSNYKIALMNSSFVFNRDTHEYFVDQLDEYEIVNQNGYVTGTSIVFKSFSEGGVLAFEDLTLPGASGGVYGPISALVVYDFDSHEKGLVVGCLTFDELIRVDQSTIKLSDLSFQIV